MLLMITPKPCLTHTIQSPERGSACSRLENVARNRYGNPRPSDSVNMVCTPNSTLCFCATIASTATTNGPTHGAAITPTPSPDRNAPAKLVACAPPSLSMTQWGGCIS